MTEAKQSKKKNEEIISTKRKAVKDSMESMEKSLLANDVLLTDERLFILSLPFNDLVAKLQNGELKAVDTLKAFQAKALEETKETNCVTELIPQADEWAKERDETLPEFRKTLHGVPVSVKENFDVVGMETTLGLVKNIGNFAKCNSVIVSVLLAQGAVPFVKTNVPQIIYSAGCSNPIFGATANPFDLSRSAGGSSGGEAALIVKGGSVLGVGSDMLGSVRIPASFCGAYGFKPTQKRISKQGSHGTYKSLIGIANSSGLLGKDTDALAVGMKAILQDGIMSKLDPVVPSIPWKSGDYESSTPLKIGWFEGDDFFPITPGCKRAIEMAKNALVKRGHEVVPFDFKGIEDVFDWGLDIALSEGGSIMLEHWEGEIIDDSVRTNKRVMSAPSMVKYLLQKYLSFSSPIMAKMASHEASRSCDLWKAIARQKTYVDNLISSLKEEDVNVVLGPAFPLPAPHPSELGNLMPACIYFAIYNFCDFPCGVLPVTHQTEEDQQLMDSYPTHDYIFKIIKKETENTVGMPLNVQVAGLPWHEEIVLKAMKEIQLGLQLDTSHSC